MLRTKYSYGYDVCIIRKITIQTCTLRVLPEADHERGRIRVFFTC